MDATPPGLYNKILRLPVELPTYVQPVARQLIEFLMEKEPSKRLGCKGTDEVIEHPWFSLYPWQVRDGRARSAHPHACSAHSSPLLLSCTLAVAADSSCLLD